MVLMLCCGFQTSDITAPPSAAAAAANDDDEDDEDDVNNMYVFEGRNYSKEPSAADCQAFQQLVDGCYFSEEGRYYIILYKDCIRRELDLLHYWLGNKKSMSPGKQSHFSNPPRFFCGKPIWDLE